MQALKESRGLKDCVLSEQGEQRHQNKTGFFLRSVPYLQLSA